MSICLLVIYCGFHATKAEVSSTRHRVATNPAIVPIWYCRVQLWETAVDKPYVVSALMELAM